MLPLVYRSPLRRILLFSVIRYNSSIPTKTRTRLGSHLLAGFVGAILGAGAISYAWYRLSGVKKTVDRIQVAVSYLDQAQDSLSKGKQPSQVLWLLRRAVKSYLAFPGSNFMVDQVFDSMDDQVDAHTDEANALIAPAYTQIRDLIQQDGGELVTQHTVQILGVLRNLTKQLQPKGLELKQMAEKYEVEKRINKGFAKLRDVMTAKKQDSKLLFDQLQQKIGSSVSRKPLNNDASPDLSQPAADTSTSKSDNDERSN